MLLVFFVCLKRHTYIYIKKRNPLKKKDNVIITVRDNCLGTRERERERNRKKGDTRTHIEDFFLCLERTERRDTMGKGNWYSFLIN